MNLKFAFDVKLLFGLILNSPVYFYPQSTSYIRLWERADQKDRAEQHILDMLYIFEYFDKLSLPDCVHSLVNQKRFELLTYPLLRLQLNKGRLQKIYSEADVHRIKSIHPPQLRRFAFSHFNDLESRFVALVIIVFRRIFRYMRLFFRARITN